VKAVFDSNIFISAFTLPAGRAESDLLAIADGRAELCVSRPIVHEVLEILSRKFDRNAEELARIGVFMSELATLVQPTGRISVLEDEPDNRILECAVAARADLIVTGDKAMLALGRFRGIDIVSLGAFIGMVRPQG
jgi:putative PIN family toxin of toxin-antitoxin system